MHDPGRQRLRAVAIGSDASAPLAAPSWMSVALATVAFCSLGTAALAFFVQSARAPLLREDGIVETAAVLFLACAVLIAAAATAKHGLRIPLVVAGGLALIELLDELSFGARLFGFAPPALHGGGELDGVHDLLIVGYRLLNESYSGLGIVWLGGMIALSVTAFGAALRQTTREDARSWLSDHGLLAFHVGLVGLAQVFDVGATSRIAGAIEEVLELNAAIVLAFYAAQQALEPGR